MTRLLRRIGWILLGGSLCLVAAFVMLMFYTRTESFRRLLSDKALVAINSSIRGTLSWQGLEGSVWRGLRVNDLQLSYGERVIFRAARAEIDYALLPLLWKQVRLTRLAATSPT